MKLIIPESRKEEIFEEIKKILRPYCDEQYFTTEDQEQTYDHLVINSVPHIMPKSLAKIGDVK